MARFHRAASSADRIGTVRRRRGLTLRWASRAAMRGRIAIPVRPIIRPAASFYYTDGEFAATMLEDIRLVSEVMGFPGWLLAC